MLRELIGDAFPCGVAEVFGSGPDDLGALFPQEAAALSPNAVEKRRREYVGGRLCAHQALRDLGVPVAPIVQGASREPLWPQAVVGSLTHCRGYVAAVAAATGDVASVGIDAEPHEPLPVAALGVAATTEDLAHLRHLATDDPTIYFDRVLFSVKEAVFKYWFQHAGHALNFDDATVRFSGEAVTARVGTPTGAFEVQGRWRVAHDLVVAAVWSHRLLSVSAHRGGNGPAR